MEDNGINADKRRRAEEFIHTRTVLLAPGEALPGLRTLMRQSGLGRVVLEAALRREVAAGRLAAQPRSGYFRSRDAAVPGRGGDRIGVVVTDFCHQLEGFGEDRRPSFAHRTVTRLYEAGLSRGMALEICRFDEKATVFDYVRDLEKRRLRRIFCAMPPGTELVRALRGSGCEIVVLSGNDPAPPEVFAVRFPVGMTRLGCHYLLRCGRRRIGLVDYQPPGQSGKIRQSTAEYYRFMAERNLKIEPHWLVHYPPEGALFDGLERMFAAAPVPDGLIVPTTWLPELYRVLVRHSRLVGRDVAVVGVGTPVELRPRPAIVVNSPDELAGVGWRLMTKLLAGGSPEQVVLPLRLLPGGMAGGAPEYELPEQ